MNEAACTVTYGSRTMCINIAVFSGRPETGIYIYIYIYMLIYLGIQTEARVITCVRVSPLILEEKNLKEYIYIYIVYSIYVTENM